MTTGIQALNVFLPLAYFVAAFLYAMHFGGPGAPRVVRLRRIAAASAIALHLALFSLRWNVVGHFPAFDPWSTLSAVALALALLSVATSRRIGNAGSGSIVLIAVASMQILASAFGPLVADEAPKELSGPFYLFHALTSMAAAAALVLSGLHGSIYLILFRQMRHKHFGPLAQRLPDLRSLAMLTRRAALAGFVLLTVGINFGIGWAHYAQVESFGYSDPWVIAMLAIWIHFGIVAFSRSIPGIW